MKKYKLIKEYPGSPKLGQIAECPNEHYMIYQNNPYKVFGIPKNKVENYPEFWEEIIEKDYEIISFVDRSNVIHKKWGREDFSVNEWVSGITEPVALALNNFKIYSIKRLSDGAIFTLGDKIKNYKNTGIKEIKIYKYGLRIITDANGDGIISKSVAWKLKDCKKYFFTTQDGVDIFEGDKYFTVWKKDDVSLSKWVTQNVYFKASGKPEDYIHDGIYYFSKEKEVKKYIPVMNILENYNECNFIETIKNIIELSEKKKIKNLKTQW